MQHISFPISLLVNFPTQKMHTYNIFADHPHVLLDVSLGSETFMYHSFNHLNRLLQFFNIIEITENRFGGLHGKQWIRFPDGKEYLVPSHMVPALDQAFTSYHTKIKMGVATSSGGVSYWSIQSPHCWMSCQSYDSSMAMQSPHPIYCLLTIILVLTGSEHPIWQDHPSQNPLPSRPCMSSHRSSCIDLMALQQLTDYKLLTLHSEVLTLQQKLGISYKDASHCLNTCEIEKLALADANHKAFKNLDSHLEQYLMDLNEHLWPQTDAGSNSNQW